MDNGTPGQLGSPPGDIPGDAAQGTESGGCERVSVLRIDLPGNAESKEPLLEVT